MALAMVSSPSSLLLASSSSSLLSSRVSTLSLPRPRCIAKLGADLTPVMAGMPQEEENKQKQQPGLGAYGRDEQLKRRAVVFGAFTSAIAALANVAGSAEAGEENAAKKNTCPKLCVQNRTASCCFGN